MPHLITIGASRGGVGALLRLAAGLPDGIDASLVVVLHIGSHPSRLPDLLTANGPLRASHVVDGQPLQPGHIHVAPPDRHVLLDGRTLRLNHGPKENHTRPAIDPLFRSAALHHGPDVIGVVLSGALDDGTAAMKETREAGGPPVVQDPADADDPSKPLSVLHCVDVDHRVGAGDMGALLARLCGGGERTAPAGGAGPVWRHQHQVFLHEGDPVAHLKDIATPSTFVCPDCRGSLWQVTGAAPPRFICHAGHGYSLRTLQHAQSDATDDALWAAIRALEEKRLLAETAADVLEASGDQKEADAQCRRARELADQEQRLRELTGAAA